MDIEHFHNFLVGVQMGNFVYGCNFVFCINKYTARPFWPSA